MKHITASFLGLTGALAAGYALAQAVAVPSGFVERPDCLYNGTNQKVFCPGPKAPSQWEAPPAFDGDSLAGVFSVVGLKAQLTRTYEANIAALDAVRSDTVFVPSSDPQFWFKEKGAFGTNVITLSTGGVLSDASVQLLELRPDAAQLQGERLMRVNAPPQTAAPQ